MGRERDNGLTGTLSSTSTLGPTLNNEYVEKIKMTSLQALSLPTLFSFIFAALKFRENFLGTFRESLISRSQRKIVFTGN